MIRRCHNVSSVQEALSTAPRPLALVPTMGALHEGHLALLRAAREKVGPRGTVAISIFVNPIQFDRPEDLLNYPKTLENDLAACEAVLAEMLARGVDIKGATHVVNAVLPPQTSH